MKTKRYSIFETIAILRTRPKSRLWNKQFNKFDNKDWIKINEIYETESATAHN